MKGVKVARRYADALMQLAQPEQLATWPVQLDEITSIFQDTDRAMEYMVSPLVERAVKIKLLEDLFSKSALEIEIKNFMFLLAQHRRFGLIPQISDICRETAGERLGIVSAEVESVETLTKEERETIKKRLEALTSKKISVDYKTSASLLGGIRIKVASRWYDASLRGHLNRLKKSLVRGAK